MADAEHVAAQSVEPAAERDIELVEAQLTHLVRVVAVRQLHCGDRIGLGPRIYCKNLRPVVLAPGAHRAPRRLGEAMVPGKDLVEALFLDHAQRLLQPVEEVHRHGAVPVGLRACTEQPPPVPIDARQFCFCGSGDGSRTNPGEGHAGRQHQAFLRAGDGDIDTPLVHAKIHRRQRRDGIDQE